MGYADYPTTLAWGDYDTWISRAAALERRVVPKDRRILHHRCAAVILAKLHLPYYTPKSSAVQPKEPSPWEIRSSALVRLSHTHVALASAWRS